MHKSMNVVYHYFVGVSFEKQAGVSYLPQCSSVLLIFFHPIQAE